jgi:predicted secreted protein
VYGSGGNETFEFLALKSRKTEIAFSYLRPWLKEEQAIDKRVFKIEIE